MTHRPQDLVFTLFGEYLLHRREPVWVGCLIALLEPFDLSEGAVRTVLSRMARKGWLDTTRTGRLSFYYLTPRGRRLLEEGVEKIFHPSWERAWDGRWLLLAYSVPERRRKLRDRLRDRLAWLGFGSLGNGLWISPHGVEQEVRAAARELGVQDHLECFRAEQVGDCDPRDLVARCWDLPGIHARYEDFLARWTPVKERCEEGDDDVRIGEKECYTLRFQLIHEYRVFPLVDPYLPRALLPEDWGGGRAARLFRSVHDLLEGPADAYVAGVLAQEPTAPPLTAVR